MSLITAASGMSFLSRRQYTKLRRSFEKEYGVEDAYSTLQSMEHLIQYAILSKTGSVISILSFSPRGGARCGGNFTNMIYNVFTEPTHRGRGYMHALMNYLIYELQFLHKRCIHLEVFKKNKPALHLYRKLGFHTILSCKGKEPSFIMRLPIR